MTTPMRRREIAHLREEGRAARLAGRHRQSFPYAYVGSTNRVQWEAGWDEADRELSATWSALSKFDDMQFAG